MDTPPRRGYNVGVPHPAQRTGLFSCRPVAASELPRIMRVHIVTGCLGTLWGSLITGILFTFFGNTVGMTRLHWGVLNAVGAWTVLAQPLGALLGERTGSRRGVWWTFALSERLLRTAAIVGAWLAWRAGWPTAWVVLVVLVACSGLFGNIANAPWWSWMSSLIPPEVQGAFWGRRDTWTSIAVIVVIVPATLVVDLIPAGLKPAAVTGILLGASAIGFVDIFWHGTLPEPPMPARAEGGSIARVAAPLRDRRFRPWLVFVGSWNFSMALGGSLCTLYFLDNLELRHNLLGGALAMSVIGLLGSIASARRMGRLVDRWGSRRVLLVGHLFWSILPVFWVFAFPRTAVLWIGVGNLMSGVFATAANNAGLKLVTRFPRPEEGAMYMAVSSSVANLANGLGALVAGLFLQAMGEWTARLGGLVVSAYPILFLASAALRLATTLVLVPRVRERGVRDEDRPMLLPLFFGLPVKRRGEGEG